MGTIRYRTRRTPKTLLRNPLPGRVVPNGLGVTCPGQVEHRKGCCASGRLGAVRAISSKQDAEGQQSMQRDGRGCSEGRPVVGGRRHLVELRRLLRCCLVCCGPRVKQVRADEDGTGQTSGPQRSKVGLLQCKAKRLQRCVLLPSRAGLGVHKARTREALCATPPGGAFP